jgi:hypothetical protein
MKFTVSALSYFLVCCSAINISEAIAADSVQTSREFSAHASKAMGLGIAASGQVILGVTALPVMSAGGVSMAVGSVGAASTAAGKDSAAAAGIKLPGPLPITDQTISIYSPAEALKRPTNSPR